jgi:hypothetical protein
MSAPLNASPTYLANLLDDTLACIESLWAAYTQTDLSTGEPIEFDRYHESRVDWALDLRPKLLELYDTTHLASIRGDALTLEP